MCDAYMQRVCVGSCIYVLVCVGVLVRVGDLALLWYLRVWKNQSFLDPVVCVCTCACVCVRAWACACACACVQLTWGGLVCARVCSHEFVLLWHFVSLKIFFPIEFCYRAVPSSAALVHLVSQSQIPHNRWLCLRLVLAHARSSIGAHYNSLARTLATHTHTIAGPTHNIIVFESIHKGLDLARVVTAHGYQQHHSYDAYCKRELVACNAALLALLIQ